MKSARLLTGELAAMQRCFTLARNGRGRVSPNPLVGAVLLREGVAVAEGWHRFYGGAHAEVECLRAFGGDARGLTMVVNLEPCSHQGKTGPCADALIDAGVKRVVVGMRDPNPLVSGRGIRRLRGAGVEVVEGIFDAAARYLNRRFVTHIAQGRPHVHVKVAQSLDGKIAGAGRWISGPEARLLVHAWRGEHDAVLVGAGTVQADNPRLNVRGVEGRDPAVIILDGALSVDPDARVLASARKRRVVVVTTKSAVRKHQRKAAALAMRHVEIVAFACKSRTIPLSQVLAELHESGFGSVLVEGGGMVFGAFAGAGVVDELSIFTAPLVIGDGPVAFPRAGGSRTTFRTFAGGRIGSDYVLRATRESHPTELLMAEIDPRHLMGDE